MRCVWITTSVILTVAMGITWPMIGLAGAGWLLGKRVRV